MTIAVAVMAATVFTSGDKFDSLRASDKAPGSIVFSRESGQFTKISEKVSSTSGKTANGATYYAIAHSNADVSETGYVAQFGMGAGSDEQYIKFSSSPTADVDFEFQRLTGIKVKTTSGSAQTLYAYYSDDGVSFSGYHSISCSSNPEKFTFTSPHKYVRLQEYATYARDIVEIELFYECGGSDPEPEPKEIDHLAFGSMKSSYVLGDEFEEPEVIAYYTDSTHETVNASFSEPDMTVTGKQTVTATYQGVSKNFTIEIWPSSTACRVTYKGFFIDDYDETEASTFLKETSVLPQYGEPSTTVSFVPVLKDEYMYYGILEETGIKFTEDGTTISFTMPSYDVVVYIMYQTSAYKFIQYVGYDLGTYDFTDASTVLDSSSVTPSCAEPGDTVSVTPVAKSGFVIDDVVDMNGDVTITGNAGVYSFTMPDYTFEVTIVFHEVVTLESIYVVSPKTTYTVGSSFVIPTVKGVYSNGTEEALEVTASNFSGFNSSAAVASQTITVSYPGVSSITYTIEIVEGEEPQTLNCTYRIAQSSTTDYKLQFNSDGTGRYYRYYNSAESWIINFTYTYDSSTGEVSIELDHSVTYSQVNNFATGYRMVQANSTSGVIYYVNDSGFINSSNQFEIDMVRVSAGVFSTDHRVFTLA